MKQRTCPTCKQKITGKAFEIVGGKLRAICPTCEYKHERRSFPEDLAFNTELANAFGVQGLSLYNARPDQLEVPRRYRTGQHSYDDVYRRLVTMEGREDGISPDAGQENPPVAEPPRNAYRGEVSDIHGVRFMATDGTRIMNSRPYPPASSRTLAQWGAQTMYRLGEQWVRLPYTKFSNLVGAYAELQARVRIMGQDLRSLSDENRRIRRRISELETQHMAQESARSIDETFIGILRNGNPGSYAGTPPQGEPTPASSVPEPTTMVFGGGAGGSHGIDMAVEPSNSHSEEAPSQEGLPVPAPTARVMSREEILSTIATLEMARNDETIHR